MNKFYFIFDHDFLLAIEIFKQKLEKLSWKLRPLQPRSSVAPSTRNERGAYRPRGEGALSRFRAKIPTVIKTSIFL